MRKKILLILSVFCFMGAGLFAQTIEGGAGVIHVDGNPNLMLDMNNLSVNEGHVAYDDNTNIVYYFDATGTAYDAVTPVTGTQWIAVDVNGLVDPITSIIGTSPVNASTVAGVTTISFTSSATLTYDPATQELVFTDVDGTVEPALDLSGLADLAVVQATNPSITVTGTGTTGDPYEISLTGATTAGTVPVTDASGNLTWTNVVENAAVNADGTLELSFTDGSTANLDLDNAPKVANKTELDAAAAALGAGESGIAVAAVNNTFGMPATSNFGVIFFIKK